MKITDMLKGMLKQKDPDRPPSKPPEGEMVGAAVRMHRTPDGGFCAHMETEDGVEHDGQGPTEVDALREVLKAAIPGIEDVIIPDAATWGLPDEEAPKYLN